MRGDRGQTLPIYIWLTGILLFTAVAFFVFAQAASVRNGAQSAADAAALAAAQDARDELMTTLTGAIGQGDDWLHWLNGQDPPDAGATAAAEALAADNGARVQGGAVLVDRGGYPGFQVAVETNNTVGASIIPGTEGMHARAHAVAVIQPRCDFDAGADPTLPIELNCDGQIVNIDPVDFDPDDFPDASVLFSVHLAE
ncbi:pilus assembly protein TadG-related protein [Streptomyces sp. WI04-05B]|uniref:pilus assembly protein TadG-related protein n=1 Tax=Streptomyces TaxID=1883 RepID=UPI0029A87315|nr:MULTISPECIES: pilus assembly protein TadG-related protein [unclassified Streptomyces]MDX2542293.1 pilus assembly protein TadG-related protein [Streptomyces sp. WI04-05B]MDX2584125.1 pilus assembly protein TadG-related protein [Streptomyces sp. WI04-05A]MDX3751174.1 pilus assembly protein TadG-related protein [Streptomyces sp. AK08-02]